MENKNDHIGAYKNRANRDMENNRRRRQDNATQLRKDKREETLSKRRNLNLTGDIVDINSSPLGDNNRGSLENVTASHQAIKLLPLSDIVSGIQSGTQQLKTSAGQTNLSDLLRFVQNCRKMLSRERKPPIDDIIGAGLVPHLVFLLQIDRIAKLKESTTLPYQIMFEAAWALTNIASGNADQTKTVVQSDAVPQFIRLLTLTDHLNVVEQAAWAIGNIAGDGAPLRDMVLNHGVVQPLINLIQLPHATSAFTQNITWTLSNLCRNKNPPTAVDYVKQILPVLHRLLSHSDRQVKTDAAWAMSYLTDGSNDRIDIVLQSGVLPQLVRHLEKSTDISILTPVLRSIGNIVTGTDEQTQTVIDSGALKYLHALLKHEKASIQKETAWTVSNITAGTAIQIQAIVDEDLVGPIMDCLNNGDFKTQKEAIWAVTNFTSGGNSDQVRELCKAGAINGLCNMLTCKDDKIVQVILDGLQNILIHAEKLQCLNSAVDFIEECGGLEKLEALQNSPNETIYQLCYRLIDTYFPEEEEADETGNVITTNVNSQGQFEFNANNADGNDPSQSNDQPFQF